MYMYSYVFFKSACGHGRTSGWPPQPEVSIPAVQGGEELLVKLQERRLWISTPDAPWCWKIYSYLHLAQKWHKCR